MTSIMWGCFALDVVIILGIVWFIMDWCKNPDREMPF